MEELGKRERLRNGEAVELQPGIFGRLNKENRTLELDSGKILPISKTDQRDLFPADEAALDTARRTEKIERQVKSSPFGEFFHQFGGQGIVNAPKDWLDYFTQTGDEYLRQKQAEGRVSQRISKESPITSGAATAASFIPDFLLTRGMTATKAAPLLTGLSAGSRIASEPGEVLKEGLFAAGAGKILDMGANALSRIAARRQVNRELPAQIQNVRNLNAEGQIAVNESNALQKSEFNVLKQKVKETNQNRLLEYEKELDARKNLMIEAENKREVAKFASSEEKKRINEDYRLAKKQYDEAVSNLPNVQKQAQQEFSNNVVRNAEKIEKAFPKESRISSIEIDVPGFFDKAVKNTGRVATNSEAQSKRILNSLFPTSETFTSKELAAKYKAIEEAIFRAPADVQSILNEFKNHLGEKIPNILAQNMTYSRIIPGLQKSLSKDLEFAFKNAKTSSVFTKPNELANQAKKNIENYFSNLSPSSFAEKLKNGELRQELMDRLFEATGQPRSVNIGGREIATVQSFNPYQKEVQDIFRNRLDNALANSEIKMIGIDSDAAKRLGSSIKKTYGMAEPVAAPVPPPEPLNIPSSVPSTDLMPAPTPPLPPRPNLLSEPVAPTPQTFNPIPEPTLPPPSGLADRAGDFLEKDLLSGKGLINNPISKLAGLKYVLGKGALPLEAAYLGMKGLTSPTAAGEVARMTFKQGGIKAVESWAQKYPSYRNGILENPQERRSLTKELEDDPEIPIEQKAVLQSKINRGTPLNTPFH